MYLKKSIEISISGFFHKATPVTSRQTTSRSASSPTARAERRVQDCYGFGARNVNLAVNVVLGIVFCSISPLVTIMAMFDLALARITYGYLVIYTETW